MKVTHYDKHGIPFLGHDYWNQMMQTTKGSTSAKVTPLKRKPATPAKRKTGATLGTLSDLWPRVKS